MNRDWFEATLLQEADNMEKNKVMFVYVAAVFMLTSNFLQSEAFTTPFRTGKRQINQTEVNLSLLG